MWQRVLFSVIVLSALAVAGAQTMPPMQYGYVPIDLNKNPGCGIVYTSKQDKIDRNLRIALYYFQAFTDAGKLNWTYTVLDPRWGCLAPDATVFWAAFTPPPAMPVTFMSFAAGQKPDIKKDPLPVREGRAIRTVFPDFGTVPGSFRAMPWENGVNFSMKYGGTTKTGERVEMWENNTFLVDDNGKIIHWDNWADTEALDRTYQLVFGRGYRGLTLAEYSRIIDERLKK